MIKNKLDEIIKTYLGKYLDYDKDKIEYSLLQGKVELKDVSLRPEAIVELLTLQLGKEFPLEVKAGQVEYVKIAIPWSNLLGTSTEVTLELSGLYLVAGPIADRPYDKKKDQDHNNAIKQAKLRSFDESTYQKVANQAEKNPGLFEKIWKYILNNVTITVSNIHIRYEDSVTHGAYSFAMGTILHQFTVHTTDKNWHETELDSQATLLHKLGKLTNLSVYWNHCVKDPDLVGKPSKIKSGAWKSLLKMAVNTYIIKEEEFEHILKPVSMEAKIIMNNTEDLQMPKLYIQFSPPESCRCIDCYLSRRQYISILKWFDAVEKMRVNMKYRKYHPNSNVRPITDAKSWWKYAFNSVIEERIRTFSWKKIYLYRQKFKEYKDLYLQYLKNPNNERVKSQYQQLEYDMDVHNIMTAREDAKVEFEKRAPERARRKKKEKSGGGFWSWMWGNEEESEDEIEIHEDEGIWGDLSDVEKKELYDKIGYKEEEDTKRLPKDYIAYKIQLEIKQFEVTLSSNRREILKASLNEMLTSYENRPEGKGVRILSKTEGFKIEGATQGFKPFTILTSNGGLYTTDKQMFTLDYFLNPLNYKADQALILNVRPVEIYYDQHAVSQVLSFFQMPDQEAAVDLNELAMAKLRGFVEYSRDTLLYAIDQKSTFHISVNMKSPYIVIPQTGTLSDSEREGHVLVVDLGTFTVESDLQDKSNLPENPSTIELQESLYDKFLVRITEVEILVADSNEDWHLPLTMDKAHSKYHILPNSSLDITFYKNSMPEDYQHPHHKFDVKLHSLTLTVTDEQLLVLYSYIFHFPKPVISSLEDQMDAAETAPLRLDSFNIQLEPDIAVLRRTRKTILSRTVINRIIPEDSSLPDKPYYTNSPNEIFLSASDDSEDEYEKWNRFLTVRSVDDYLSANNRMRMYMRIQIIELVIQLSLQEGKQRKEYLMFRLDPVIVDIANTMYLDKNGKPVDCGYAMYASVGAFKMADKLHQRIVVMMKESEDMAHIRASGAYLELLRTESDKKLITFSYRQVLPKCPDFGSVYSYIENAAGLTCHNVSVMFDQTVMRSLKKFIDNMQERLAKLDEKLTGPNLILADVSHHPPPLERRDSRLSNYTTTLSNQFKKMADEVDSSDRPTIKLHLVTCIKDVSLQLCNVDKQFSQMEFKGFESQFIMKPKKITFNCRLKEMSIKDLTKYTLYPNILIIEKEDDPFFDLKVEKFSNKDIVSKNDKNIADKLDYRVKLRIGHLQLAYISKFFWEITSFFDPFKTPEIVEAATAYKDMMSKQVTEIHPSAMRISIRVAMDLPTIVIPKHSKSPDLFMFQFRTFSIDNSIKKTALENGKEQDWNIFRAHLKEMQVSRGRLKENEFHMLYHIIEPVNFEATFGLALAPFRSKVMYDISGDVDVIKVKVQQSDIRLMFEILRKNLTEGAPQSNPDVVSPSRRSSGVDDVDSPTTEPGSAYNALVTLQGLTLCLYDEKTDLDMSPFEVNHRNILSLCEVGKLVVRVNTYTENDITMDVNITLHSLCIDDAKSDSALAVKRIFHCHQEPNKENYPLPLISVVYKSRSTGQQEADIRMDKVIINLNIPHLMALNEFYQTSFQADDDIPVNQARERISTISDQLDSGPTNTVLQVKGIVKEPKIVLFADPEKYSSRILVLDTDIEFEMYTDAAEQKIKSSIKSMKMYSSIYGQPLYENSVIKPCNVDFSRVYMTRENKTDYCVILPQLDIYITPTVLHLLADVTKMLSGPEKKEEDEVKENLPETDMWSVKPTSADKWTRRIDDSGSAVDPFVAAEAPTESLILKIKKMNSYFRVRNLDYDVDLLHLRMSIEATVEDWQKQLQMTSDIHMEARYFNEKLSVWEPLMEQVSEKEGQYRPWECVVKVIRSRSYPMTFNYVQDGFSFEDTYRNNVQKLLQESKRRSSSSESDTDDSVEKTVMRHKISRTRSRITSDKSFESLSQQGSIQGESDTEPDGLIQSMTNKLGGIFSDSDSSQDADISENDDNGDLADASLEKPVFITSKGPVHIALDRRRDLCSRCKPFCCQDQSMYDELDAGSQIESVEEGEKEEARPQSYYIILASQDQLLLNVTPPAIDVITDVTTAMMTPEAVEGESKSRPAFEINNQLGLQTSVVVHPDIKIHDNHVKRCQVLRQGKDDNQVKIVLHNENDERIELPDIKEECDDTDGLLSHDDGFLSHHLAAFGNMVTSAGAFVFDDDPDYLSGDKMDINRLKIQVDGFDLSSTIYHKRACQQLFPLTPDKHSTKYWYLLHIDVWHGSKIINIMSPLKIENKMTVSVDVYCKTEDLKQYGINVTYIEIGHYSKLQTLHPDQDFIIPLFLAYNCDIFVSPTDLREYKIQNNGIWWKDIQRTKEKAKTYTCAGTGTDKLFNIKVYLSDGQKLMPRQDVPKGVPYFTLILKPPVMIHNYLPYDLQFSLEGTGTFSSLTHGECTPLYTIEPTKSYKLHLQMQDYLGCDWTGIFEILTNQDLEEFKAVNMTAYDSGMDENAYKHLTLIVHANVKMSLDLYIYSPYWIVNKTDLPILIRGSNSDAVYDCTPSVTDTVASPFVLFRFKKHKRKKAKLKVYESKWSQSFSVDTIGNTGVIICYDKERKMKYRLLLQCQWSHLKLSRIVTITPFFLVINKSIHHLRYMEKNEEKDLWLDLKKGQCSPFWPCTDNGRICVKYENSNISSSYICINTVHSTVLRMESGRALCVSVAGGIEAPRSITFEDYDIGDSPVRIENLCEDVFIVIHQSNQHQMTVLGANQSVLYTWDEPAGTRKLMWNVYGGPNKQDQELDITKDSYDCKNLSVQQVMVADTYKYKDQSNRIDSSPDDDSDVVDTVDSPQHQAKLKTKSYKMTMYWVSFLDGQQRVVLFTCDKTIAEAARLHHVGCVNQVHHMGTGIKLTEGEQANYVFLLSLSGIGVSIINMSQEEVAYVSVNSMPALWEIDVKNKWKMLEDVTLVTWLEDKWKHAVEHASLEDRIEVDFSNFSKMRMMKPYMGELRRVCPPGLFFQYGQSKHQTFIHAKIHKVQVDNQLLDAYFQTALYSSPIPMYIVKKKGPKPFLEFGMIRRRVPENNIDTFRQFQIIMQELHVQLDWGFIVSIQDVFASLFNKEESEKNWSERLRSDLLLAQRPLHEIACVMASKQPNRIFFEFFKISPIKVNVSFSLSGTPHLCRDEQPSLASDIKEFLRNSVGATLTEVKDIELKMVHFEHKGIHITKDQMMTLALAHYRQQLIMQLYVIILGLDVLGNPYGLFKDFTTGIGELFYEPVMDTLRGDENFSENMARGFQSAIGHIVGGTSNSVARVTGSFGNAFAYMSFDEEFQRKRKRRQQQPPRDLPHSLALAGQGFLSGIKYGLTGIVLDPIHGATEDGVEGFFKGMGKGLLGLITQPIGGVLDLVSMAFDGVRRTAEMDGGFIVRMRLPRYINPYRGLQPFSQYLARGSHLLNSLKGGIYSKTDVFIDFAPLSYKERADLIILTNRHILYLDKNRFSSGYDVEWEIELQSIIGVPALLDEDKKIVITLKDNTGTVFSGNHVEISSEYPGIIKWLLQRIEHVLKQQIYK